MTKEKQLLNSDGEPVHCSRCHIAIFNIDDYTKLSISKMNVDEYLCGECYQKMRGNTLYERRPKLALPASTWVSSRLIKEDKARLDELDKRYLDLGGRVNYRDILRAGLYILSQQDNPTLVKIILNIPVLTKAGYKNGRKAKEVKVIKKGKAKVKKKSKK